MSHLRLITTLIACLALGATASAETQGPTHNLVSFNVEATAEVDNDLLVAVLAAQRDGSQPQHLADEVNEAINWAIGQARANAAVKVQTQSYNTQPVYRNGKLNGWRVSQAIRLESRDAAVLSDLVGRLQERLTVQSLAFEVSDEARGAADATLTGRALDDFVARARAITERLGRNGYRLVQLNINGSGGPAPRPMLRAMAIESSMPVAAPVIESGTQRVAVSVNGTIELTDD